MLGVAAAAVLVMLYLSLGFALNGHSDAVAYQVASLPPEGLPVVTVADPPVPKVAVVEPPPIAKPDVVAKPSSTVVAFRRFLDQEIKEGLVDVSETRQAVTVRLVGDGMFDSGSAGVRAVCLPTLERVAQALNDQPGDVLITGHTDNVPIGRTIRFQSNFALSLARADAVRDFIGHRISNAARMRTEGKAEWVPIASNATPEGRQKNRRIELVLIKTGEAVP
ncbi:MAG: type VI secretion system protein TssL, long form [Rhodospirillaceae bacterium]